MTDSYIISRMNEFMFQLTGRMGGWLANKLPRLTDRWWDDLVLNNLSTMQRAQVESAGIITIEGLDLSTILRIYDRNWFVITSSYFINNKERQHIRDMKEVRNTWAHISAQEISKEKVVQDVNTIIELMCAFDASSNEVREMEGFIFDIEEDEEIQKETPKKADTPAVKENTGASELAVGSVITLVSDPSVVGAVIGISGDKYSVLIESEVKSFYKEQIMLKEKKNAADRLSLDRVKASITAYQINNPGSANLYSLNSARIDFVPYQFRPALKLIKADSPRLLVADDVGVGKTIEAGLILKELEARSNVNSVLIICPRPLVAERKWELEMKRFDEDFTQMDGKALSETISETDRDGEWPERHRKTIIPYSLFSEDVIMGRQSTSDKKKKSMGLSELDPMPRFDLVIVDEAHNIRNSNTWAYKGVELFCQNADAVVFLTATPLQNSNNDLYTLLNLLRPDVVIDKDTFKTMAEPNAFINNLLRIVRRQDENWQELGKQEIAHILNTTWGRNVVQHNPNFESIYNFLEKSEVTREEKVEIINKIEGLHSFNTIINRTRRRDIEDFCIRRTITINVPFNGVQRELYESLMEFEEAALTRLHGSRSVRFMMCTIMRQASSCIYGLAPFLNDLVKKRMSQIGEDGELYEYDFELNCDEENSLFELADNISELKDKLPESDPKFDKLIEVIDGKQQEENNRVIIFSSFRHTLAYIRKKLIEKGIRVGQVDGSVSDEDRYRARQLFLMDRAEKDALDVLLFSEVGCEGLDYQFCDTMINYDLPWNPMRIEQRIGRIDRRGQKSDTVRIYNLITEDTIDATIYNRCLSKIGVFEASIGDCSEILGDITDQIMKIMFDPTMTEEERQMKIEQMADNEVMKVQELNRLEQEEKTLYGFDMESLLADKDVQDAENDWISPANIQSLVELFLNDLLGEGEYLRGKQDIKSLQLSGEKRQMLFKDLKQLKVVNNNTASRRWTAYLKSDKQRIPITFDSVTAKDNRDVAFFTQMHPFVMQAAQYESKSFPCEIGIRVSEEDIPTGDYEFLIYAWRYVGLRPDIRLMAISENEMVQKNVLSMLQYASEFDFSGEHYVEKWEEMDSLHYKRWQEIKGEYVKRVTEECDYRIDQLTQSFRQRELILKGMIESAGDEKIIRMRTSQLNKLKNDFEDHKKTLKDTISQADIHTNLLIRGVLHVD
ncbi:MAG: DEAD/DEAH box helicase family protein [Acetatifactor sp.]|nr:DEAD/DEAH box helicase family protein [Acetatifactor sp.]